MASQRFRLADLSDDDRQELESWLVDFDQNWEAESLPTRVNQIPPGSSWRLPALAEMVKIDLERRWEAGHRVGLESYLRDFPELGHPDNVSLDLILAEVEVRRQFGDPADVEEYARRFPHQAERLRRGIDRSGSRRSASARRPATPRPDLPEQFGRYRILRRLGRGGMGSVFLAEDERLGRLVALKVSHFEAADEAESRERFDREARAAAKLDHPYLCPVHDVGIIDGIQFLTMAYIEGKTLAASVRDGGLPQRQVAAVVGKLALALQEAHARGVVHRDLKPSNVMIKETGTGREPVIVDFGLARHDNAHDVRMTKTGQALGTPAYMAPEQVRGDLKEIGPACDVYALGVILYELLTGRLPFSGSGLAVVGQILTQEPLPPSALRGDLDPRLEAICLKAMARKVKDRHSSMADLAAALTDYLRNPAPASPPSSSSMAGAPAAGAESREAGSDTLVGQFLARMTVDTAPAPPLEPGPGPEAEPVLDRGGEVASSPPSGRGGRSRVPLLVAAGAIGAVILGVIVYVATDTGRIRIAVADPRAVVTVDGATVRIESEGGPLSLRAGTHELEVRWGDGQFQTREFVVRRGDNEALRVEYAPHPRTANASGGPGGSSSGAAGSPARALVDEPPPPPAAVARPPASAGESAGTLAKDIPATPAVSIRPFDVTRYDLYDEGSMGGEKEGLGKWHTEGGELVINAGTWDSGNRPRPTLLFGDRSWTDYDFSFRVKVTQVGPDAASGFVMVFRSRAQQSQYEFMAHEGARHPQTLSAFDLGHPEGEDIGKGGDSNQARNPIKLNEWYTVRAEVRGDRIRCFLSNGVEEVLVFDVKDARHPAGRVGLKTAWGIHHFKDIKVTASDGTVLWEGLPKVPPLAPPAPGPDAMAAGMEGKPEAVATTAAAGKATTAPDRPAGPPARPIGMKLALIPAGEFFMGSTPEENPQRPNPDEYPMHPVRISRPFLIGRTEVTQGQYQAVVGANPSHFPGRDDDPVENVSWLLAVEFCNKLSVREGLAPFFEIRDRTVSVPNSKGLGYRLPTEAEWEYACRAGSDAKYAFGNDDAMLVTCAWVVANANGRTHPVAGLEPNAFGLFDMHGNVQEWCWDVHAPYSPLPATDPTGPPSVPDADRVYRNGAFDDAPFYVRSSYRGAFKPTSADKTIGFRVARNAPPSAAGRPRNNVKKKGRASKR